MSMGSQITDTARTLIVAGTVAFLGYLGYTLVQSRIDNPPPRIVTLASEDLETLRSEVAHARSDIAGLQRQHDLLKRDQELAIGALNSSNLGLSPKTRVEFGTYQVTFTHQESKESEKNSNPKWFYEHVVQFKNRYARPPVVLVSDDSVTGAWPHVAVMRATTSEAVIKLNLHYPHPGRTATIAYLVIGESE